MDQKDTRSDHLLKIAHLIILSAFTITILIFLAETFIRGWDKLVVPFALGLFVFCWYLNLMQKFTAAQRIKLYALSMMFCFFFYGIHETGLEILSVSAVVIILLFLISQTRSLIWLTVFTYFFTVFFNLAQAKGQWEEGYEILTSRLVLQGFFVFLAGGIAHFFISERHNSFQRYEQDKIVSKQQEELAKEQICIVARELSKLGRNARGELLLLKNAITKAGLRDQIPYDMDRLLSLEKMLGTELTDLKDFSDMISGKTRIRNEAYEILDLLEQSRPEDSSEKHRVGPDLIIDIDPMVPKAMVGDREKIIKIIRHLVGNAVRYTEKGGILVKILTHSYADEFNLYIEVRDTGIGMEKNELERLIRQLDEKRTAEYRPGGLGMGLYLVSGFVKCMGGFIRIESEWGKGTRVCVSIPQRVSNAVPCMSHDWKSGVCIIYEDSIYTEGVLNGFYEDLFRHISEKLLIPAYAVKNEEEIKTLIGIYPKVCLFTEQELYEANTAYYEGLKEVFTVVLTKGYCKLPEGSIVHVRHKPVATPEILRVIDLAVKSGERRRRREDNPRPEKGELPIGIESLSERRIRQIGGRRIMIVTDSMSDLPPVISMEREIPVIPFRIHTESASFLDDMEISQEGALKHLEEYPGIYSTAPEEEEFRSFFESNLRFADHIIYISTSRKISASYDRAVKASERMDRVTVFNSGQVSGGVALMAIMADEEARLGKNADEIVDYLKRIRPKIKTSFLIDNLDHLAYVGRVDKFLARIFRSLMLHPVMVMKRDVMAPGGVYIGRMERASEAYMQKILKRADRIDKTRAFISSIGMNVNFLREAEQQLRADGLFADMISRHACASVSINCGTDTFGIIYVEK
ncbi:MAG: DegV family EDD domain-containing protein [Lachnospiraceae bacterium]|nr:DegV family EDD domain-containing protein [Lachnospiraceae bacterium]